MALSESTVGDTLDYLGLSSLKDPADLIWWPPDVFAVSGFLLKESGTYLKLASPEPKTGTKKGKRGFSQVEALSDRQRWSNTIRDQALNWRKVLSALSDYLPVAGLPAPKGTPF